MSPNVCSTCHFHTEGCLQSSHLSDAKGGNDTLLLLAGEVILIPIKLVSAVTLITSYLRRNQSNGLPQLRSRTAKAAVSKAGLVFPRFRRVEQSVPNPNVFRHTKSMFLESMNYLQLPATTRGGQQSVDCPYNQFSHFCNPIGKGAAEDHVCPPVLSHPSLHCM